MQKKWIKLAICLLAFVLAGTFYCLNFRDGEEMTWDSIEGKEEVPAGSEIRSGQETGDTAQEETTVQKKICVHICGEVKNPGVYELAEGSRIYELLELAGGALESGMPDAVNLADILMDGERIVIPSKEEASLLALASQNAEDGVVNLNTASLEQLMTLPGIGEAKAKDIIEYRESNGGFREIADVMKISGIKEALFQKIQDRITV